MLLTPLAQSLLKDTIDLYLFQLEMAPTNIILNREQQSEESPVSDAKILRFAQNNKVMSTTSE
jgi:hypothetical protein